MSEQEPSSERHRIFTHEELIRMAIERAHESDGVIDDAAARLITVSIITGKMLTKASAIEPFYDTGAIALTPLLLEVGRISVTSDSNTEMCLALMDYIAKAGERGPVDGWKKFWPEGGI